MILESAGTAGILSAVCKTAMFAVSSLWRRLAAGPERFGFGFLEPGKPHS
jgi:hypothetical protein